MLAVAHAMREQFWHCPNKGSNLSATPNTGMAKKGAPHKLKNQILEFN
jgi:hypothetical protein